MRPIVGSGMCPWETTLLLARSVPLDGARREAGRLLAEGRAPDLASLAACGYEILASAKGAGGRVPNALRAAAAIGAPAGLLSAVGDDAQGVKVLEDLRERGVDVSRVHRTTDAATPISFVFTKPGIREPRVLIHAPHPATRAPTSWDAPPRAIVHIAQPRRFYARAAAEVVASGGLISLDVGSAFAMGRIGAAAQALLAVADIVQMRLSVAKQLARHRGLQYRDPLELAARLRASLGRARLLTVTLGPDGAAAAWSGDGGLFRPRPVNVLDPTGAGDCLAGVVLAGFATGEADDPAGLVRVLARAVGAAAASVTTLSAGGLRLTTDDVETSTGRVWVEWTGR